MVDRLCTSLGGLSLSATRRYTALAAEREDCIVLTIGEPDLPTPAPICEAAVRALAGGSTHYTTNQGSASLRAKLAAYEAKTRQLDYGLDEILVTAGATEAIYCALTGILDPGDEVVIPTPAFGLYETVTRLAGAVPVYLDTARTGFQLTYEALCAAITPRTKALVLNIQPARYIRRTLLRPSAARSETGPSLYSATTFTAGCARGPVRILRPCPTCGSGF